MNPWLLDVLEDLLAIDDGRGSTTAADRLGVSNGTIRDNWPGFFSQFIFGCIDEKCPTDEMNHQEIDEFNESFCSCLQTLNSMKLE